MSYFGDGTYEQMLLDMIEFHASERDPAETVKALAAIIAYYADKIEPRP